MFNVLKSIKNNKKMVQIKDILLLQRKVMYFSKKTSFHPIAMAKDREFKILILELDQNIIRIIFLHRKWVKRKEFSISKNLSKWFLKEKYFKINQTFWTSSINGKIVLHQTNELNSNLILTLLIIFLLLSFR